MQRPEVDGTEPVDLEAGDQEHPRGQGAPPLRRAGRRRLALFGLVAVWGIVAAWFLVEGALDIRAGKRALDAARAHAGVADLVEGRPVDELRLAHRRLDHAHSRLASTVVAPVRILPFVGRQLRSLSAMAGASATVADVGADGITRARPMIDSGAARGGERAAAARQLADVASGALRRVENIDLGPSQNLLGPLARARAELAEVVDGLESGVRRGAAGGRAVATLLEGPRRYLVFAANNAEMRAGSGMFLSMGVLEAGGGGLRLQEMGSVNDVPIPPDAVTVEGDLHDRWGWLNPTDDWRQLMLSPRFDVQAPLAAQMWAAGGRPPVDGVLVLDPVAFSGLLHATGPVQVGGRSIGAGSVIQELLHDQYLRFTAEETPERREQLGQLAGAAFNALDTDDWSVAELARGMAPVVEGRHLLAWSARPEEQADWSVAGVDGALRHDSLLVGLSNRGANKLDYFQRVTGEVDVARADDESLVTLRLRVRNTAPTGEPPYVAGDEDLTGAPEGTYLGIVSVNVPGAARDVHIDGVDQLAVAGPDGPTQVVGSLLRIPRDEERTVVVRFVLPGADGALWVEPSARVPGIDWTAGGRMWTDSARQVVTWSSKG